MARHEGQRKVFLEGASNSHCGQRKDLINPIDSPKPLSSFALPARLFLSFFAFAFSFFAFT